jgi:hypothetical protein
MENLKEVAEVSASCRRGVFASLGRAGLSIPRAILLHASG